LAEALEAAGHWRDAMPFLSHLIEIQPNNSSRLLQLARMKSWQAETRSEALTLFTAHSEKPEERRNLGELR